MKVLSFLILNLFCLSGYAAGIFDTCYGNGCDSTSTDIFLSCPEGFSKYGKDNTLEYVLNINPDYMPMDALYEDQRLVDIPSVLLMSDDGECMLFYCGMDTRNPLVSADGIKYEIGVALGNEESDVNDSITVVAGNGMPAYANADTAYIYKMDLPMPYLGKYAHTLNVNLRKYAHPALRVRIFMTDKSLSKADEYLKKLLANVRYGDVVSDSGLKAESLAWELEMHRRKHGPCRHVREAIERNKKQKSNL